MFLKFETLNNVDEIMTKGKAKLSKGNIELPFTNQHTNVANVYHINGESFHGLG